VRGVAALSPHLEQLEAEAIHVIREVAAELEKPVLLFSGELRAKKGPSAAGG